MSLLSPLKTLLGNVERGAAAAYNDTFGNFTGGIGPFPRPAPVKPGAGNGPGFDAFYKAQLPSRLQAPQQAQSFNSYRPGPVARPEPQQLPALDHYLNPFLLANQQLQPFGFQGEDNYSETQAIQPVNYSAPQASLNGQFNQGPMASFYRLTGR